MMFGKLNRAPFVAGFGFAALAVACNSAYAQEGGVEPGANAASGVLEEVEVRGIRRSIETAMDIKRDSINAVDAIAAEDVGKMPDQNVAESLQRIPGVTIERNGGDGQFVSVRGLGPDFNAVTINGRTLATDNIGRAFSFDVLPSELITGAEVYKSPIASTNGASIGATIDIKTIRPLDQDEFVGAVSIKNVFNELADSNNPSLSGLLSYRNEEGTFGVAVAASYVSRETRTDNFAISAGHTMRSSDGFFAGRLGDGVAEFSNIDTPSNIAPTFMLREDDRIGFNAAIQFRPSEDVTHTIDALYTSLDQVNHDVGLAFDFSGGTLVENTVANGSAVYQKLEGGFVDEIVYHRERPSETKMLGYNLEWINDDLTLDFDVSYSEATIDDPVNDWFTTVRRNNMTLWYDRSSGSPIYDYGFSSPDYANAATDVNNVGGHYVNIGGSALNDKTFEVKLDGKWEADSGLVAYAGIAAQNREKTKTQFGMGFDVQCAFCGGTDVYGQMPSNLFAPTGLTFFEGTSGNFVRDWIDYDVREYTEALRAYPGPYVVWMDTDGYSDPVFQPEGSSVVKEDVINAYFMVDFETELAGMPMAVNTGVRIESTDFSSNGAAQTVLSAVPNGTGQNIITLSDVVPVGFEGDYVDILPSLNVRLNLTDDLVARFAASRVMTRPTLDDLSPAQFILSNPGNESITRGNPDLLPFRASQADLGLEWYFAEYGMLSFTTFYKNIDSFVTQRTSPVTVDQVVFQVTEPENGDGATVSGFEIGYRQMLEFLPIEGFGVEASYTNVSTTADFANEVTGVNYGLEGLSENSYSAVAFYEQNGLSARLAYTYRDEFLQVAFGRNGDPEIFDAYDQLDGSVSYEVTDNLMLMLEALNLTDSDEFIYSTTSNRTKEFRNTGRRFTAGLRYRF